MPLPQPELSDGDIVVRMATPEDIPAILAFFLANRSALAPFSPRRPESFYTAAFWEMRVALNLSHFEQARSACLFIFTADNQRVLGDINFSNLSSYPFYSCTLGYGLAESEWGKGRMQRALQLALPWAFETFNLHRIAANHLPDNLRSARLLEKLGFQREGFAPDYLLIDGVWRDHVLTALTRQNWQNWQARDHNLPLVQHGHGRR